MTNKSTIRIAMGNIIWGLMLFIICMLSSCAKEDQVGVTKSTEKPQGKPTVLGKRLENPYSVENMQKAYENLKAKEANGRTTEDNITITTTHHYIRFKPKDQYELAILKQDSTLKLYEYPLDYEITEPGDFYHDPTVPEGQPTYQYCAVKVDKQLPDSVTYDLLAKLFIPDETPEIAGGRIASQEFIDELVNEALRITGNLDKESASNGRVQSSSWRPAGTIRVWDNSITPAGYRPIEGVKVKARRWFTTHDGVTNAQGYYSCDGSFKNDANYSIDWERYEFALREAGLMEQIIMVLKRRVIGT